MKNVWNNTPHKGFNALEWFLQESLKFDLFLDIKTMIAPVKLKLESSFLKFFLLLDISFYGRASLVLKYCLLLDISFYGRAEGSK